jgi:hypothetical protein
VFGSATAWPLRPGPGWQFEIAGIPRYNDKKFVSPLRRVLDDKSDIERFIAMFEAHGQQVRASHARTIFYQWLALRHLRDGFSETVFLSVADAITRECWLPSAIERSVKLEEFIASPKELLEVSGRLQDQGLEMAHPQGIDPVKDPMKFVEALETLERERIVPLVAILPLLTAIRHRVYQEAWQRSARGGKVDPIAFGAMSAVNLRIQIHGDAGTPSLQVSENLDLWAYIGSRPTEVFTVVDLMAR